MTDASKVHCDTGQQGEYAKKIKKQTLEKSIHTRLSKNSQILQAPNNNSENSKPYRNHPNHKKKNSHFKPQN